MAQDSIKRLYVQNVDDWEKRLSAEKGKFSDKKLDIKIVENAIVLPARNIGAGYAGGVCDNDFNFVAGYTRRVPPQNPKGNVDYCDLLTSYTVDREQIVQLDEDVIFGGTLRAHFGHFLIESWSRLWYVLQHPESKLKILFVTYGGGYRAWFDDFFRLMGIDKERIIYVKQPTQCRSIIIPDQSAYAPNMFMKEFFIPYQAIKEHVTPSEHKKIYLTRRNFDEKYLKIGVEKVLNLAHCFNEKYFEDFFSARGFKVVAPETLTPEEQISLVMGADELVATLGTLTHFALFCKPTAKFIMLPRTNTMQGLHFQLFINKAINFKTFYIVDVYKSFLLPHTHGGECLIGSTKYWKEFVADYFGEEISKDDDYPYLGAALDEYTDFWCQKYVGKDSANFNIILGSLRDICKRIVALEQGKILNRPLLTYQTHVSKDGWVTWKSENQFSNPIDQQRDIQAVKINFAQPFHDVFYSVYYGDSAGWSQEVSNGSQAGTTGLKKSIFGIKIRLDDSGANEFDILYRVHTFDGVWSPWAKNGELLYAHEVKLNALQIKLQSK